MALSLKTLCQRAIRRVPGFAIPDSIVTNTEDDIAQQLWECAQDVGEELARDYDWQELLHIDYTFVTADGTATYDLPSDFMRMVPQTTWDRSNTWPIRGPLTGEQYQTLKSGIVTAGLRSWVRIAGSQFIVVPTPTAVYTFAFDYYSNAWCESSTGTGQTTFAADTDLPRLDSHIFILGTRYYFKKGRGLPYADDQIDYYNAIASAKYDNSPSPVINMTGKGMLEELPNLPETGFGS